MKARIIFRANISLHPSYFVYGIIILMEQLTEIHKLKNYEYNLNKNINDLLKQLSKYEDTSHLTDVKIENDRIRFNFVLS